MQDLEGGVFLNIGSAVTGPEVYLKALSMARNVARQQGQEIRHFTTAVFDLVDLPADFRGGTPVQGSSAVLLPSVEDDPGADRGRRRTELLLSAATTGRRSRRCGADVLARLPATKTVAA